MREAGQIGRGYVIPGSVVDDKDIQHELGDLGGGNALLPRAGDLERGQGVVEVHQHVYRQIKADDDPRNRRFSVKLGETQNSGGRVMIDMKESKWLLLEDEENRVDKLPIFKVIVDHVVGFQFHSPSTFTADTVVEAITTDDGDDLFEHQCKKETRAQGECEIVE